MNPLITANELLTVCNDTTVILADVSNGSDAYSKYLTNHLEHAVFVDLNNDLAAVGDPRYGGRHPLPELKDFMAVISKMGIDKNSRVVCYDHHYGANAAARFWWMLRATGHTNVQMLDGGFQEAVACGFPQSNALPQPIIADSCDMADWQWPVVQLEEMKQAVSDKNYLIVDVRDAKRYSGIYEPIDTIAGHISGAVNMPYLNNLDVGGHFKKPEVLAQMYRQLAKGFDPEKIIVHCGSGVTACHTILAFAVAGLPIPTLYTGSWSEWSRNMEPL